MSVIIMMPPHLRQVIEVAWKLHYCGSYVKLCCKLPWRSMSLPSHGGACTHLFRDGRAIAATPHGKTEYGISVAPLSHSCPEACRGTLSRGDLVQVLHDIVNSCPKAGGSNAASFTALTPGAAYMLECKAVLRCHLVCFIINRISS